MEGKLSTSSAFECCKGSARWEEASDLCSRRTAKAGGAAAVTVWGICSGKAVQSSSTAQTGDRLCALAIFTGCRGRSRLQPTSTSPATPEATAEHPQDRPTTRMGSEGMARSDAYGSPQWHPNGAWSALSAARAGDASAIGGASALNDALAAQDTQRRDQRVKVRASRARWSSLFPGQCAAHPAISGWGWRRPAPTGAAAPRCLPPNTPICGLW